MAQRRRITQPVKGGLHRLASSSPEVEEAVGRIRVDLFELLAEASRQIGSLSTRLQQRADALQHAVEVAAGLEEKARGRVADLRDPYVEDDDESDKVRRPSPSRVQRDEPSSRSRPIRRRG